MTNQENRWKRLIIKWTAAKGFVAMLLFLASALLLEYLLVYSFLSGGLTDEFTWMETFQVPYVNWAFTLAVSPLLHLLPLSVIIVLISSWIFLTRHIAFIPHRTESARKTAIRRRRPQRRRFKSLRRFFKRISRNIQEIGKALKNALLRIPGFSRLSRRLFFARTAVRSAMIILSAFVSLVFLAYSIAYPWWIHDTVINLYRGNPSFTSFVIGTNESFQLLGEILVPINNALLAAAPGFRSSLQNLGASTVSIANLDITGKYLLVQNMAAWICALVALAYGKYAETRRYRRR
ncbi:MAG: hypothetical protein PVF15_05900 [Candidatus Bathyarchaeota archaeon]|jgi:hypothetical protein